MTIYSFASCELDTERRELRCGGEVVRLQPLVLDLLVYFARHPGRVISRQELLSAAWRSAAVTPGVVTRAVMKARRAIGDDDGPGTLIVTVNRAGYRFDATPGIATPSAPAPLAAPAGLGAGVPAADDDPDTAGPTVWSRQVDAAAALARQGHPLQALRVLEACLPHVEATAATRLLQAQLLRERGEAPAAGAVLAAALQADDARAGTLARVDLLGTLALCRFDALDLAGALHSNEMAMQWAQGQAEGRSRLPALLSTQALLLSRAGRQDDAISAAQRGLSLAITRGDDRLQAQLRLRLAMVLVTCERTGQAAEAAAQAALQARQVGLLPLETDALLLMATLAIGHRQYSRTDELAQQAAALYAAAGDAAGLAKATMLAALAMTEADRLDEAQERLQRLGPAAAMPADRRIGHALVEALLAWKQGHADESSAAIRAVLARADGAATVWARSAAFELTMQCIDRSRLDEARQLYASHVSPDPKRARGATAAAALALAGGQRREAVALLRAHAALASSQSQDDMDARLSLAWLLLEDESHQAPDEALDALAAPLLDYGQELLAARVFRAAYLLRRSPSASAREAWDALVAGAQPLHRNGPWLLRSDYRLALQNGGPPPLPQLLVRACQ